MFVNPDQVSISRCILISNKAEVMIIELDAVKTAFKDTSIAK